MRRIIEFSLKAHRAVVALAIAATMFGIVQLRNAETEVFPEFDPPIVRVQTDALGLSAEEVEQLVTVPIEQDLLDGVPWLDSIHSKSVPGLSYIEMVFDKGTPIYRARQVVQERISQAAGLPNVSRPPQMLQPQSSTSRTAMVSLSSKKLSPIQIGVLARFTIRPRLLAVSGVSNVAVWGQRERQLQVLVDPAKLRDKNVAIEQIVSSTGNALWVSPLTFLEASTPGTGGFIDTANQRLGIQHNLPLIEPKDLAKVAIDDTEASPLTLGDVATVVEDHQPLIGDAVVEGDGNFLIVVEKLPNANTADVARGIEDALQKLRPGLSGLRMDTTVFRPTTYLDKMTGNFRRTFLLASALLLVGLIVLLGRWKKVVVAACSVVVTFILAATALQLFGVVFNVFVVIGLAVAVGAVIDQATGYGGESMETDHGATRSSPSKPDSSSSKSSVADNSQRTSPSGDRGIGSIGIWGLVIFATALLPIFFLNGLSGDSFFPPLARASIVTLVVSLLVSLTLAPALSRLLNDDGMGADTFILRATRSGYRAALGGFGKSVAPAVALSAVLAVGGGVILSSFDKALLPRFKDTNLLVRWQAPYGTSLPEMTRVISRATSELRAVSGVRMVGAQIGQAVGGDRPVGSDSAEMFVSLKPSANYSETVNRIKSVVAGYPGLDHRVTTYAAERLRLSLGRTSDEISVRVFGQNLTVLREKAGEIQKAMKGIKGISKASVATQSSEPTIQVEVDLAKAQALAIKPGDVRRASETLLSGLRVGNLFQDQKIFDVIVWGQPEIRKSVSSVRDLLIDTPNGKVIRLGDVADVTVRPTPPIIEHEDISRYIDVTANVKKRSVGKVKTDVQRAVAKIAMPDEFHATILSDYAEEQNAQRRVFAFAIAGLIGVFLLFQATFRSWRLAIISTPTVVLSMVGGLVAARIFHDTMSLATVAGLMAVGAVATRFNLALLHGYLKHRSAGSARDAELVQIGAQERLGPTLTTVLLTALVLLPVFAFGSIAGQELLHPMAVVIIGGLITTLMMMLFVLPALYFRFGPEQPPQPWDMNRLVDAAE